jgi:hypothetical protein
MLVTLTLDYRTFTDKSHFIYIGLLAVLVYVLFFGTTQMGARRWIFLKVFNLQPSEFAKVGVALVLAKFFGEKGGEPQWTDLAIGALRPFRSAHREEPISVCPHAGASLHRGRISGRHAPAASRRHLLADRPRRPPPGCSRSAVSETADFDLSRSDADAKGAGYQQFSPHQVDQAG